MKKKNLLNENTVRRFMRLAEIDVLANDFIREGGYAFQRDDELEDEEEMEGGEEEMEMGGEEAALEDPLEDDPGMEVEELPEPEEDMGMGGEEGGAVESVAKDVLSTIAQALNDKYGDEGLEINLEAGEEDMEVGGEEEMEMGGEEMPPMEGGEEEMEMGGEEMPPMEGGEEEEEEEELALENVEVIDDDVLVENVLKRVAKRLHRPKSRRRSKK